MPVAAAAVFNPFPGLRPFRTDEDYLFFGREGQSKELLTRLREQRFLAVVGSSGSGKSSLVKAGLLPYLFGGFMAHAGSHWRVALFRPGSDPIGNLAAALNDEAALGQVESAGNEQKKQEILLQVALRRSTLGLIEAIREADLPPHDNLLIVVDQFEELFRFTKAVKSVQAQEDAAAFVNLLLEAGKQTDLPVYIAITMRSDFIGDCARYRDLPEAVTAGLYLIPRMTRDQRREAIESPIKVGGATISRQLVNRLLNDGGEDPNQLPKLQHALMRTWAYWEQKQRPDEPVDLEDYKRAGGLADALSEHADEAFHGLPDDRYRHIAKRMFQALTERGSENREIRRPTRVAKIAEIAGADVRAVIEVAEAFRREGRSFLTPSPDVPLDADSIIDISHESLISGWKRLQEWVEEEAQSAKTYRRLAETAALHEQASADLWDGLELSNAWAWREREKPTAAWAENYYPGFARAMAFLEASKAARDQQRISEEKTRSKELRRVRIFAAAITALLLVAILFAVSAVRETRSAKRARHDAEEKTTQAQTSEANAKRQEKAASEAKIAADKSAASALAATARAQQEAHRAQVAEAGQAKKAEEARIALQDARSEKNRADQNSSTSLEFAGSAIRTWQSLSDVTTAPQELQDYYERLLEGAQDVHKTIMSNTPDNMELMEFYILDVVSLPDLHLRQNRADKARQECTDNEATAKEWAQDKSILKRTLAADVWAYAAKTRARMDERAAALKDAVAAAKMADGVSSTPAQLDDRGWDDLSVAYSKSAQVEEQYGAREEALHDYQRAAISLAKLKKRSADLTHFYINYLTKAADLQAALKRQPDAQAAYEFSIGEAQAWVASIAADPVRSAASENEEARIDLADTYVDHGDSLIKWKQSDKAEEAFKLARVALEKLHSKSKDVAFELSLSDERLGNLWRSRASDEKDAAKQKDDYRLALKFHESAWQERKQVESADKNTTSEYNLGIAEWNVGSDYRQLGDDQMALSHFRSRLAAYQLSAQLSPAKETTVQIRSAARDLGDLYAKLNQPDEALKAYETAVEADLAQSAPEAATIADDLQKVVELQINASQTEAALATYTVLIQWLSKIADKDKTTEAIDRLFWAKIGHGDVLWQSKKYAEAQKDYADAQKDSERMDSKSFSAQYDRAAAVERFGNLYFNQAADMKDQASREQYLHLAADSNNTALERFRAITEITSDVMQAIAREQQNLGRDFRYLDLLDQARQQYTASVESSRKMAAAYPSAESERAVANALSTLQSFEDPANNFPAGKAACTQWIAVMKTLISRYGSTPEDKRTLASGYGDRAWFEIYLGEYDAAIRDADEGLKVDGNQLWILVNKAHALLLAGRYNDAMRIYHDNIDKPTDLANPNSPKFGAAALADFEDFRKRATPKMNLALLKKVEPAVKQALAASSAQQLATVQNQASGKR